MEEIEVKRNDTLLCYTDGLVELENEDDDAFEDERLVELIHENFHLGMEQLNALIFRELKIFKGKRDYLDDTAILSCRFFG